MFDKSGEKDGILLFKVTGNIDRNIISNDILDSRKSIPTEAKSDNPIQFYYETKFLGDGIGSWANNDGDSKDLVKSITVTRTPNNVLNKNKNIENIFKFFIFWISQF